MVEQGRQRVLAEERTLRECNGRVPVQGTR
jgi:hypothetical protein